MRHKSPNNTILMKRFTSSIMNSYPHHQNFEFKNWVLCNEGTSSLVWTHLSIRVRISKWLLILFITKFRGTRIWSFITVFTRVHHRSISGTKWIYSKPISPRSIPIPSSHLRLGLPSGLFPSCFPTKTLYSFSLLSHACHMPSPHHSPCLDLPNFKTALRTNCNVIFYYCY
jgi:hypothetical protein